MKSAILLVEDDPVWRTMLTRFLNHESDMQVVQAVETKEAAILYCSCCNVDIVLMDLNLNGHNLDGIQATLELSLMNTTAKVIVLTALDADHIIIDTYTAGAVHYVNKCDFRNVPDLIRGVVNRLSPQDVLIRDYLRLKEAEQLNKLTVAEKEIVALSEEGVLRSQMFDKLGKTEGTLKNQITSILRKFDAKSLKEVVQMIKSRGLGGQGTKQ